MAKHLQMYNWPSVRDFGYGQASSDVQLATSVRDWLGNDQVSSDVHVQLA